MPSGRPEDKTVTRHFSVVEENGKKRATCLRCNDYIYAKNSSRMKTHLLTECTGYKAFIDAEGPSNGTVYTQPKIDKAISAQQAKKDLADERAAMAIYASNRPFSLFNTPEFPTFLGTFGYTPPTRHKLAGELLDKTYLKVKEMVTTMVEKWRAKGGIGLITDESTNVTKDRIHNICVVLPNAERTILLWNAAEIISKMYATDDIIKWIKQQSLNITNGELKLVISLSSDTCEVMMSAGKKIKEVPGFEHMEWVPCDSHGLQLLIKDICELPGCAETLKSATKWIKFFSKAPKQLHIVQIHLEKIYGKRKALIKSVITRRGTQVSEYI